MNPFLKRTEKRERVSKGQWRSPKQEKGLAKRLGILQVPASGRGRKKGDLWKPNLVRIEAKTTQHKSFSITREMLDKISLACMGSDEIPVIIVEFLDAAGKPIDEVAVLPSRYLEGLINADKDKAQSGS